MDEVTLSPYLNFQGNTEEALKFYQSVFGGELELSRFGDFPNAPASYEDKIMHGVLKTDDISFMASEGMPGGTIVFGDNVNMSLSGNNEEKLNKFFSGLSEGGTVTVPLAKQMWGDTFGMLTDKFNIRWLVNITAKKEA